jgi:leader peptidase (prepilin peptidase)/N-methyltransferase
MEGAILTAKAELDRHNGGSAGRRVVAAWDAVGRPGRVLLVGGGGAAIAATAAWIPITGFALATTLSVVVLAVAAMVDVVEHRLPDALVGAAAAPVIVAMGWAWVAGDAAVTTGAAIGAAVVGGPLLATHLVSPAGMGFGDVKAGTVLGAALALVSVQIAVLALVLGLAGAAASALAMRRRSIALGPGLVAGAAVALVVANVLHVEAAG